MLISQKFELSRSSGQEIIRPENVRPFETMFGLSIPDEGLFAAGAICRYLDASVLSQKSNEKNPIYIGDMELDSDEIHSLLEHTILTSKKPDETEKPEAVETVELLTSGESMALEEIVKWASDPEQIDSAIALDSIALVLVHSGSVYLQKRILAGEYVARNFAEELFRFNDGINAISPLPRGVLSYEPPTTTTRGQIYNSVTVETTELHDV